ncbi:hypothetical protein OsJ_08685 [Oryza sativa Japonica Group]|nr:hypothetical protein OsJ_08685 [Oryza sativa Japonica Group]
MTGLSNSADSAPASPNNGTEPPMMRTNGGEQMGGSEAAHIRIDEIIRRLDAAEKEAQAQVVEARREIFRVPGRHRLADEDAYQPSLFSVGPYHRHGTEEMGRNELTKVRLMKLQLGADADQAASLQRECLLSMASLEQEARRCYDGDVAMDSGEFCMMLLVDGAFLIAMLTAFGIQEQDDAPANKEEEEDSGPGTGSRTQKRVLVDGFLDLVLLENQIPFFVVHSIFGLLVDHAGTTLAKTAWNAVRNFMQHIPTASNADDVKEDCKHLVDLCHTYLRPAGWQQAAAAGGGHIQRFRTATEYSESGVRFRVRSDSEPAPRFGLLDVDFSWGVVTMSRHVIDEKMSCVFRNVLAFEQDSGAGVERDAYVTAYVVFMSQLLGSAGDVAVLSRSGVMEHSLGNDGDACALFRGLARGLAFDTDGDHYLRGVGLELNRHHGRRLNRWLAWVARRHFDNPWLILAWLAAAVLLLCTLVQTVFAVMSYRPSAKLNS